MSQLTLNNIDKSSYESFRFDEIASMVSERVDPNNTDLEIYVGLEHLDAESLHIKRHGTRDDVNGTKLRFYPGDVIFGRRRAYQRKAAIATTDGFCSAHGMVLRANPEVIDPGLFPFFIHSDQFMHRAVDISVGSLSPTINWKSLRKQEFLLPPKAEQERLAELLWAGDAVVEGLEGVLRKLQDYSQSWLNKTINKKQNWPKRKLETIAKVQTGRAKNSKKKIPQEQSVTVPYLRVANVQDGYLDLSEIKEQTINSNELDRYGVQYGDVLMNEGGDHDKLGRGTVWRGEIDTCIHQNHVFVVRTSDQLMPEYLSLVGRSNYGKSFFLSRAKRTSNLASINSTQLKSLPVPLPPIAEQKTICDRGNTLEKQMSDINYQLSSAKTLQKSLINQIF